MPDIKLETVIAEKIGHKIAGVLNSTNDSFDTLFDLSGLPNDIFVGATLFDLDLRDADLRHLDFTGTRFFDCHRNSKTYFPPTYSPHRDLVRPEPNRLTNLDIDTKDLWRLDPFSKDERLLYVEHDNKTLLGGLPLLGPNQIRSQAEFMEPTALFFVNDVFGDSIHLTFNETFESDAMIEKFKSYYNKIGGIPKKGPVNLGSGTFRLPCTEEEYGENYNQKRHLLSQTPYLALFDTYKIVDPLLPLTEPNYLRGTDTIFEEAVTNGDPSRKRVLLVMDNCLYRSLFYISLVSALYTVLPITSSNFIRMATDDINEFDLVIVGPTVYRDSWAHDKIYFSRKNTKFLALYRHNETGREFELLKLGYSGAACQTSAVKAHKMIRSIFLERDPETEELGEPV